ncbi:MAG: ABC transporter permease [Acidobacteriota bacterium]
MWFGELVRDLRYAGRSLRGNPAFTLVAVLSLTLGIGATASMFSVIYGILISPYPYARPGEIWAPEVRAKAGQGGHGYTMDEVRRMAALPVFSDVMATSLGTTLLTDRGAPESFTAGLLTGNAFRFLGVPPLLGRAIEPSDVPAGVEPAPVVVLSHRLWLRLFDGSPAALGQTLRLDGVPHTVIGVMPPRFGWYGNDSFWLPLSYERRELPFVAPIVRLAPGVSAKAATDALAALNTRLAEESPAAFPPGGFTTVLRNYLDVTVASGEMRTSLRLLLGAVGFLLLISCANVANLQLARGSARAREMAVRLSIGADRSRLLRQLLTESLLLSLIGGAAGVAFAYVATGRIVALMPELYVPNESRVEINLPVLLVAVAVSLVTGIVSGLAPALQTSRPDITDALKASRSTSAGQQGARTRRLLVVGEVALCVVLLASAGLTVRTFIALQQTSPGFSAERVLIVNVPLAADRYATRASRIQFTQSLLARVSTLPGVEAAAYGAPFGGAQTGYAIAGVPIDPQRRLTTNLASEDYLRTFGISLRSGRMFDAGEVSRGDRVAVVNETAAKLWPGGAGPVGSRLHLDLLDGSPSAATADPSLGAEVSIVGVIADTRNTGFRAVPAAAIVLPYTTIAPAQRNLAVRSAGDPAAVLNPIRAQLREMDPEQPLGRSITVGEILGREVVQPKFTMALFLAFAVVGLSLAAAGIYSVLSFHVARRTHELGVRMALGATRAQVLALMLAMGGRLVLTGLAVGIPVSLMATRVLRSQLFGVEPAEVLSYVAVVLILGLVALAACYLPARRAARVDPMVALRQE